MIYWKQAIQFYSKHLASLFFILPFLFIPVFSDCLHSELIRQDRMNGKLNVFSAIIAAGKGFFPLLFMKLQFEFVATLWAFIPVIGWFKDLDHRLNWSMASNVLVFEKLKGLKGVKRCVELRKSMDYKIAVRALFTMPVLLTTAVTFICAMLTILSGFFVWIMLTVLLFIFIPLSAAVNTLVYLSMPEIQNKSNEINETTP